MAGCSECRRIGTLSLGRVRLNLRLWLPVLQGLYVSGSQLLQDARREQTLDASSVAGAAFFGVWMAACFYIMFGAYWHYSHAENKRRFWALTALKVALLFLVLDLSYRLTWKLL